MVKAWTGGRKRKERDKITNTEREKKGMKRGEAGEVRVGRLDLRSLMTHALRFFLLL
jgi:hypothetical protein